MYLPIISVCKTNLLRGLKQKIEYKYKMTVPMVIFITLCLYSLLFFSPPKKVCFANRNIGQIHHLAYVFYFISVSILTFLNLLATRFSLLLFTLVFKIFTDPGLH